MEFNWRVKIKVNFNIETVKTKNSFSSELPRAIDRIPLMPALLAPARSQAAVRVPPD
jgi:hypothetical protein